MLNPIFTRVGDGKPVEFYFHSSLTIGQEEALVPKIQEYGGAISNIEDQSDVIIVDHEHFDAVQRKWSHSKRTYVEKPSFIDVCIHRGQYYHTKPLKDKLPGRPLGSSRNEFTIEDDQNLALYIARRIPDASSGGRTGNKIYQELVDEIRKEQYPWASRHTWQSWRERYKKDPARRQWFDQRIVQILEVEPPHPDGKGEYLYTRSHQQQHRVLGIRRDEHGMENNNQVLRMGEMIQFEEQEPENEDPASTVQSALDKQADELDGAGRHALKVENAKENDSYRGLDDNVAFDHNVGNDAQTSHSSAPQRAHTTSRYQEIDNTQDTVVASTDARTVIPIVEIPLVPSPSRVRTRTARNREQTQAVRSHASIRQRPQTKPPRSSGSRKINNTIEEAAANTQKSARKVASNTPLPIQQAIQTESTGVTSNEVTNNATAPNLSKRALRAQRDAPYRNTRARSKSIEPIPHPPLRKARKVAKAERQQETVQAEEQSVEAVEMVLGDIVEEDEDELDGGSGSDAELERMAKVLRGADLTKSTLGKDIGDLTSLPIAQSTPQRTPLRTRVRSGDETQASRDEIVSETDFPYPGTRARGEKKRRLDEVKKKPFTPFRGTRAAQMASRRTAVAVDGK